MKYVLMGGTGSLGTAIAEYLFKHKGSGDDIVIFSRGEHKQQEMKRRFPNAEYLIGDIRDRHAVREAVQGADTVFHLAALKHIDVVEKNPKEGSKTNVKGTEIVADECRAAGVRHMVFSSTDKAVLPITAYGAQKMVSEKMLLSMNNDKATHYSVFRWGNVLGSNGSVVHYFAKTLKEDKKVYITHKDMTRFWIMIEQAAAFFIERYLHASDYEIQIYPDSRASSVERLAQATARVLGIDKYEKEYTGVRICEKIHECLESTHEYCLRSDTAPQYTDEELIQMVEKVLIRSIDA